NTINKLESLPIPVPNVLPGILSIVFMYVGYLVVKYFMP
ncbi:XapX domain-containing protein, partial [Escherichia coli]